MKLLTFFMSLHDIAPLQARPAAMLSAPSSMNEVRLCLLLVLQQMLGGRYAQPGLSCRCVSTVKQVVNTLQQV